MLRRCFLIMYVHVFMLSCFSRVGLLVIPGTVACQTPPSMGFSRKEYWSGLPSPPSPQSTEFPDPGIKLLSAALQADSLLSEPPGKPQVLTSYPFYT